MSMMIIFLIFLIPVNILCNPTLVQNAKISQKSSPISVDPSNEPDVIISKFQSHELNVDDNRTRRNAADLDIEPPIQWSYLRQYICGASNPNCMRDESRFHKMRPDLLKQISKIATSNYDWASKGFPIPKEHFSDVNVWNSVNLSGRREGPLYVEEPDFVLVKGEDEFSDLFEPFYRDDPFIPQRGRKNDGAMKSSFYNGMLTDKKRNSDVRTSYFRNKNGNLYQNRLVNTMTMTRQFQESKKSALSPIYDICCPNALSSNNGISKLCFVRCYKSGMKIDPIGHENHDSVMPQEVAII